ncbi:MAG: hypothetical protein HY787_20300 [Deltaproteobacteria bacterium]|nr:hypothetical protein [Deltaproteobacteria bacterium]
MDPKKIAIQNINRVLVQMYLDFMIKIEEAMWVEKPKAEEIFKEVYKKACRSKLEL